MGVIGEDTEAALHRCFYKKMFWKYAVDLQENNHDKVRSHFSHFCSPVNLLHIFRTPFHKNTSGVATSKDEDIILGVAWYVMKVRYNIYYLQIPIY